MPIKNYEALHKEFLTKGFFVCKNILNEKFVSILINDISEAKNTQKFFDNNNIIRRVEKLYNKSENLINLNNTILNILKNIFNKDFTIFKDKFNAKPPGGEGFYAHYDGIFEFINEDNDKKKGWYEYGNFFINALVALDPCDKSNGTIEIAKKHLGNFDKLLTNTKNDGTPALSKVIENQSKFELINLNSGDIVFFLNTCPHRSKKNQSNINRRILYYTYSLAELGSKYNEYFEDKLKSKNKSKALL
jgi:ectoine hydroxylase-related dioxygenase (phytanoyl-CoA dioxygenase family)